MVDFIPEMPKLERQTPYFEDCAEQNVPGRRTEKAVDRLQAEISQLLFELGATGIYYVPGKFPGIPFRYGFQIHFSIQGIAGRIDCAALPIRKETPYKIDRAKAQCLYLVRDWLQNEVYSWVYRPGSIPLVPYLIGENGMTVTEALVKVHGLPMLAAG